MALVVETGSGVANANSYSSLADANSYFENYPSAEWSAATDPEKETALIAGTQYVDERNASRFKGKQTTTAQALRYPRTGVKTLDGKAVPSTSIPTRLRFAVYEVAREFLKGVDLFVTEVTPGDVSAESVTVGPISTSTSYLGGGKGSQPRFAKADYLLTDLIHDGLYLERG